MTTATATQFEPGIYEGMPFDEYRAIEAVNWSSLSNGTRTAEHVEAALNGEQRADTKEMKFGRAAHTAILRPLDYQKEWKVLEGQKTTTIDGCITEIENNTIKGMVRSLQRPLIGHPEDMPTPHDLLFGEGKREFVIVWRDMITGVLCKAMIDSLPPLELGWFADYKTAANASPAKFNKEIFTRKYYGQMSWYHRGLVANGMIYNGGMLVAQEKKRPYAWCVYPIDREVLDYGYVLHNRLLKEWSRQKAVGVWKTYGHSQVVVPPWFTEDAIGAEMDDTIDDSDIDY